MLQLWKNWTLCSRLLVCQQGATGKRQPLGVQGHTPTMNFVPTQSTSAPQEVTPKEEDTCAALRAETTTLGQTLSGKVASYKDER